MKLRQIKDQLKFMSRVCGVTVALARDRRTRDRGMHAVLNPPAATAWGGGGETVTSVFFSE